MTIHKLPYRPLWHHEGGGLCGYVCHMPPPSLSEKLLAICVQDVDKKHEAVRVIMDALHQYEVGQRKAREEIRQKAARQKARLAAEVNKTEEADPQVCKIARACGNTNIHWIV